MKLVFAIRKMELMNSDFRATKLLFDIPKEVIYLDGNSLGPPTKLIGDSVNSLITEKWAKLLIKGWNRDKWIEKPLSTGNRIAKLIGAQKDSVVVGDTLAIKTYQALFAAIKLKPKGKIILSDTGNFPSDLYIANGLINNFNLDYKLRLVKPENVFDAITEEVAIVLLTEIDYRTSRKHDMQKLTKRAHKMGAVTVWDLAHSVGALPVALEKTKADFAVGCTYKYLNGGPGSPAFLYVAPRHNNFVENVIKGWLGHAAPFDFAKDYTPSTGVSRMQIGTPPVIALTALETSLNIFDGISIQDVREQTKFLTQFFIEEVQKSCPMLKLASPYCSDDRGSHVAFEFDDSYAVIQALIARNVIGDFRSPDLMRFGFNPLFINYKDVTKAVQTLTDILQHEKWNEPQFKTKNFVT